MGCLTTNNCCCCFSLRTGGLIFGWMGAIVGVLSIILNVSKEKNYYKKLNKKYKGYDIVFEPETISNIDLIQWGFVLIMSALLLYGIYKKKSWPLLPNVIFAILWLIGLLIDFYGIARGCIRNLNSDNKQDKDNGVIEIGLVLLYLPFFGLAWHFVSVIYSLYKEIKEGNQHQPGVAYHVGAQRDKP